MFGGEGTWLSECVRVQGTKCVKLGYSQIQSLNHLPEAVTHLALSALNWQRQSKTRNDSKGEVPHRRFSLWRTNLQLIVLTPTPAMAATTCPFCALSLKCSPKEGFALIFPLWFCGLLAGCLPFRPCLPFSWFYVNRSP